MKHPTNRAGLLVLLLGAAEAMPVGAQERMEIDVAHGRVIVEGAEYDFSSIAVVGHDRRILYVVDAVEPLGVMALSIDDGARLAMYGGSRGEGPGELRSLSSLSLSPAGVLVAGGGVINHWSREGDLIGTWRPRLPDASHVPSQCVVDNEPVVPSLTGAVRREPDGSWVVLGRRPGGRVNPDIFGATHITCIGDVAYVLDEQLVGYSPSGDVISIPLPAELEEISRGWRERLRQGAIGHPYGGLFHNGKGQLVVVLPRFAGGNVFGAIIDPGTGCHTVLTAPDALSRRTRALIGMYQDSAVVAESEMEVRIINGVRTPVLYPGASRIALLPLRSAGGTPCPDSRGN